MSREPRTAASELEGRIRVLQDDRKRAEEDAAHFAKVAHEARASIQEIDALIEQYRAAHAFMAEHLNFKAEISGLDTAWGGDTPSTA